MTIPKHWFRFVTKSHLMELGEKPPYYPDCRRQNDEPYVFLLLTDSICNELPIDLWNECITVPTKFNRDLLMPLPAITVVAVTNLKASTSAGTLRHGSSPATHVYINPEIPETTSILDMYDAFLICNHQIS
ncbi:unnamed protein product [Lactuca virosa]|uniref:Uncharacterized protein n=1 Tax=Lactuca virosa TaxID=75947 RepID=A0AAU9N912_9ASTR|nr:unnamed protein product [Lactuca virosa]